VDHFLIFVSGYIRSNQRFTPKGFPKGSSQPQGLFYLGARMDLTKEKLPLTADEVARRRLETYLSEKLDGEWDDAKWEFYTWLLEKAKSHKVDRSGYRSFEFQDDYAEALKNVKRKTA
jgi:hypothetical protein